MFKPLIRRLVAEELDRRAADIPPSVSPPAGYHPLEAVRGAVLHWIPVPFNGRSVWCELRCLNASQQDACGSVTLLDVGRRKEAPSRDDLIDMRNTQERLARAVMCRPSFDEVVSEIAGKDLVITRMQRELNDLKATDLSSLPESVAEGLRKDMDRIELYLAFLLPEDTLAFITAWALGADVSDIKSLSRAQLLEAAILATNGHDSPHDHIEGRFTDRDKGDIDKAAWSIFREHQEDQESSKKAGTRWIHSGSRGR